MTVFGTTGLRMTVLAGRMIHPFPFWVPRRNELFESNPGQQFVKSRLGPKWIVHGIDFQPHQCGGPLGEALLKPLQRLFMVSYP